MNDTISSASLRPAISEAERARRAYAVRFGAGSTRLEGGILTDEAERSNASFVAGELTQAKWIDAILASDTVHRGGGLK